MERRQVLAGFLALGLSLCGCQALRNEQGPTARRRDDDDDDEAVAVGVRAKPPKGFFKKGSRLPGGLSPEAREIENNFGIE
jgi:hypothetical protein